MISSQSVKFCDWTLTIASPITCSRSRVGRITETIGEGISSIKRTTAGKSGPGDSGPLLPAVVRFIDDMPSPIVSVILPTRDREHVIGDAIASVQSQNFTDWELIIVDDGSTDDTVAVVAPYLTDS